MSAVCALAASSSGFISIASSSDIRIPSALDTQGAGMLLATSSASPGLRLVPWVSWANHGATARHVTLGNGGTCAPSWTPASVAGELGERSRSFAAGRKKVTLQDENQYRQHNPESGHSPVCEGNASSSRYMEYESRLPAWPIPTQWGQGRLSGAPRHG